MTKPGSNVTVAMVAEKLGIGWDQANRQVQEAISLGYLVNLETRPGYPAQLKPGAPMPKDGSFLPHPDVVKELFLAEGRGEGGTFTKRGVNGVNVTTALES